MAGYYHFSSCRLILSSLKPASDHTPVPECHKRVTNLVIFVLRQQVNRNTPYDHLLYHWLCYSPHSPHHPPPPPPKTLPPPHRGNSSRSYPTVWPMEWGWRKIIRYLIPSSASTSESSTNIFRGVFNYLALHIRSRGQREGWGAMPPSWSDPFYLAEYYTVI